ncbi:transglycosylase domain-containing protein [Cohnella nanjingensis]|uniref:PBP1A family penicillin-binding protein n=1 Tax=Cohnella nanjingensis TaxID=1387779 RepID=A0A7X0RN24_9BACL|nr:PBP1A family penicillin-binding protein [Cohnella nanjingensis]MBB6670563.1 PBP1A family penicillin-binding protein [Cohnella nanjingensis]
MRSNSDNQLPDPAVTGKVHLKLKRAGEGRSGRRWRWVLATIAGAFVLLTVAAALMLKFGSLPHAAFPQSTQILDERGNVLSSLSGGVNRRTVALKDISPWLVKATLAVEDRRFYAHAGVDFRGLVRAAWVDIRHGSRQQGASTLTQQLARNLYLSHERTWTRKAKEAWYAAMLEQKYAKDEILEMYLNQIYYGHGAYGAEAAAQLYFGKPAKALTLAESALLAGIPKGPRYYSPHFHLDQAKGRQRTVLQAMADTGAIGAAQAKRTDAEALAIRPLPENQGQTAPYFADYVRKIAVERLGIDERLLSEGGLRITTTLDARMQREAEAAVDRQIPESSEMQAALVSIDPKTGYIKAMVGGRHYMKNPYNRVFASTRQPGSSFKAIVYAAALDKRAVTAVTRFRSEPTLFYYDDYRKVYRPSNYNDRYFGGEIGLRQAIRTSDNIFAVHTIMEAGPDEVIGLARRLGISSKLSSVPSLALGTFPVSPYEMAAAYAVFANGGAKAEPTAILRIADREGHTLYTARPRSEQIVSPALAYVVTDLLKSVFDNGGTAHRVAHLIKRPVAGKSGTTSSDAWFVGYTPELATAVWVGYDRGRAITSVEAHRAAPIFAAFTEAALAANAPQDFAVPDGVVSVNVDPSTGLLAAPECPGQATETFLAGTEPTDTCAMHGGAKTDDEHAAKRFSLWSKVRRWWGG